METLLLIIETMLYFKEKIKISILSDLQTLKPDVVQKEEQKPQASVVESKPVTAKPVLARQEEAKSEPTVVKTEKKEESKSLDLGKCYCKGWYSNINHSNRRSKINIQKILQYITRV